MGTLCRVCIKKASKYILLNTKIENSSNVSFFDFLNKCTSLNACESDKLPQSLCSICTYSIKTFYSFVKLAEKSDTILRESLKNSIAAGRYNDNREIPCEEITMENCKIEQEPEGFSKEESLHNETIKSSTGSSLFILDFVKEEPRVSESTLIAKFKGSEIYESEKLHCNLYHPEGSVEEPDDILLCINRHLASKEDPPSVRRSDRLIDNRGISCEEITIKNEKIKEESEELNKEESLHCQTDENSTRSSLYILNIEKEEPRVSESTSIVYFKDTEITESEKFHSNLDQPEESIGEPDDTLSCIDGDLTSIVAEHIESEDDERISLLKRRLVKNEGETHYQSTKIKCEDHFRIGHGSKNQVSNEAKDDSLEAHLRVHTENTYKCIKCDIFFNNKEEFRTHCRNHIYRDKHMCNFYGKKFARRRHLNKHLVIHGVHTGPHKLLDKKHKCEICSKKFSSKHNLNIHMENHMGITEKCDQCDKVFTSSHALRRHLKLHTEQCEKCEICGKKFSTKRCLNFHMEYHSGITKKCVQCDKEFKNSESLRRHMKRHTNSKCEKCEICDKKFRTKRCLNIHMENHNGITKKCDQCNKEFTNSETLKRHMKLHTEQCECAICSKKFTTKQGLNFHMESHNGIRKKCDQCDKEFKNSETLRRHMKLHTELKYEKCEICGKQLTKRYFNIHMDSHNGITKKCDHCDKVFGNRYTLWKHMKLHTNPKYEKCEICNKNFNSKHYLNIHMENHKGIKKKCDQCDKEFKNSDTLRRHMKLHTELKYEKCEICGKQFTKRYLNIHMDSHNGITKKCDHCDKEFGNSYTLWKHMKRHTNPKCEKCEICGKKFTKRYLNIHMDSHNGITKKCDHCDKEFKNSLTLKRHMQWHTKPFKCENCGKLVAGKRSYTKHIKICKPVGNSFEETLSKGNKGIIVEVPQ